MSIIKLGQNYIFNVIKTTKEAYIVTYQNATLELPKDEAIEPVKIGDFVDGFVFMDQNKNIVVTMKKPLIDTHRAALVDVVEVKPGLGVFVNVGLSKDMLVSKDDLPFMKKHWPNVGDKLFCYLKSGKNQIIARLVSRFKMVDYFNPEQPLVLESKVTAFVFYISEEGYVLFTEEGHELFVFFKHVRDELRLGQSVEAIVTVQKDDRHYNATLIEQKEIMIDEDAKKVLEVLTDLGGTMPYTDKSSPEEIYETFRMSKAAFKRALGSLYKAKKVSLEATQTVLIKND
jgi:uncharacterized protein